MNISIYVGAYDLDTQKFMSDLHEPLKKLSAFLSQDFGGEMENLWIEIELSAIIAKVRPVYKFRFQKRIAGKLGISGEKMPDDNNVGHYSVRPDFTELHKVNDVLEFLLKLVFKSTEILFEKKEKFPNLNITLFRQEFMKGTANLGYDLN